MRRPRLPRLLWLPTTIPAAYTPHPLYISGCYAHTGLSTSGSRCSSDRPSDFLYSTHPLPSARLSSSTLLAHKPGTSPSSLTPMCFRSEYPPGGDYHSRKPHNTRRFVAALTTSQKPTSSLARKRESQETASSDIVLQCARTYTRPPSKHSIIPAPPPAPAASRTLHPTGEHPFIRPPDNRRRPLRQQYTWALGAQLGCPAGPDDVNDDRAARCQVDRIRMFCAGCGRGRRSEVGRIRKCVGRSPLA
jgi:hypothetical protein